jgi:hypothetical protein
MLALSNLHPFQEIFNHLHPVLRELNRGIMCFFYLSLQCGFEEGRCIAKQVSVQIEDLLFRSDFECRRGCVFKPDRAR